MSHSPPRDAITRALAAGAVALTVMAGTAAAASAAAPDDYEWASVTPDDFDWG